MKVLVIGGSRFVGPYIIDLLVKHKHKVTVFNRGTLQTKYPKQVIFIRGNRDTDFAKIKDSFDVVIDTVSYTGDQTKKAINQLKFKYFLNFGTVAAYQKTEIYPLHEDSQIGIYPAWGDYNKGKVECEQVLKKSKIKYATIRPTYIMGPKNYCDRENFIYSRLKKGLPIIIPGNGQALTQFVFAHEVAEIIVSLAEKQLTGNFNIAGDEIITLTGLVEEMAKIAGFKANIKYNPKTDGTNLDESEFPFSNENMVISNQKIKDTLNFKFTPLIEGLKKDYKSFYKINT